MRTIFPKEKTLRKPESGFWRHAANFFTVVLFLFALLDWQTGNGLGLILFYACLVSTVSLAVYCGEKEFERWNGYHRAEGGGEAYIMAWTLLLAGLFFFGSSPNNPYIIPPEVIASYLLAIAFFAITEKSKSLFLEKRRI